MKKDDQQKPTQDDGCWKHPTDFKAVILETLPGTLPSTREAKEPESVSHGAGTAALMRQHTLLCLRAAMVEAALLRRRVELVRVQREFRSESRFTGIRTERVMGGTK